MQVNQASAEHTRQFSPPDGRALASAAAIPSNRPAEMPLPPRTYEPDLRRGRGRKVLMIDPNQPAPINPRVWQEARELVLNGYSVTIICPVGRGYNNHFERIDGIDIFRHPLPLDISGWPQP